MSSRRNPMYAGGFNDPSMAQAAAGIANLFAPPSGTDAAGFANAGKTNLERSILQEMFNRAQRGDAIDTLDPFNYALRGNYGNTVGGEREKLRSNETIARGNQSTDLMKAVIAPVAAGAYRAPLPATVGTQLGLSPAEMAAVQGTVTAGEGQRVMLPNGGGTFEGRQRPLNIGEAQAIDWQRMNPDIRTMTLQTGQGVENTVDPTTNRIVPQSRAGAVTTGAEIAPRDRPQQVMNYRAPNGAVGTAVLTPSGWTDSQTRQPIPQGSFTFNTSVQGNQLDTGVVRPTAANNTEGNRREANLIVLRDLVGEFDNLVANNPGIIGIPGAVRGMAQDLGSVLGEFQQAFGSRLSPEANVTADQVRQIASTFAPSRDPAIQQARLMASDLAYKYAQAQNPSGEVSRQAFERALETLTGGMLRNNQSTREALAGMRQFIDREIGGVQSLRNPGSLTQGGAAPAPAPSAPQQFQEGQTATGPGGQKIIFRGGQWVPVQ